MSTWLPLAAAAAALPAALGVGSGAGFVDLAPAEAEKIHRLALPEARSTGRRLTVRLVRGEAGIVRRPGPLDI